MASLIKIKRSSGTAAPSSLSAGELAYSFGTGSVANGGDRLYFGTGSTVDVIGGKYFTGMLDHTPGALTASSALVVDSNSKLDNLKVDNLDLNENTISSTNTDGNIVLDPNGNGKVEFALANNSAAYATVTGPTATQYKENIVAAADGNAIPNKQYVDDAILATGAGAFTIKSLDGTPTSAELNFATEDLEFAGAGGIEFAIAQVFESGESGPTKVKVTATLSQSLDPSAAVKFTSVTVDNTLILDNNTVSTTSGDLTLTAGTGGNVVANRLEVTDLTETRVVFVGAGDQLVDDANFTFNSTTDTLSVTGAVQVDNVDINGNTISTTDTNGNLVLSPNGTGSVDVATSKIINVVDPTAAQDAATKNYVDTAVSTATSNTTLTVDGDSTTADVNLSTDDLQIRAAANLGLTSAVAKVGTDVTVTLTLAQDIRTSASPTFQDMALNGGDLTTTATTFNLVNTNATTVNFAGAASAISIGSGTSTVTINDDLTVTGDLIVNGTTITANVATIEIEDPLIKLARGNTANALDIGFFGEYDAGAGAKLTGLFRDASDSNKYKLFADGTVANNLVTVSTLADLVVGTLEGTIDGGTY